MNFLTFDKIKAQLRLDDEQAELERDLLEGMGDAAEEALLAIVCRSLDDIVSEYGDVPARLVQCGLMLVDEWYQHRSPVSSGQLSAVPYAFDFLLRPLMRLSDTAE